MNKRSLISGLVILNMLLLPIGTQSKAEDVNTTPKFLGEYTHVVEGKTIAPFKLHSSTDKITGKDLREAYPEKEVSVYDTAVLKTGDLVNVDRKLKHIVVYGDVTEDGKLTISDVTKIIGSIVDENNKLSDLELIAADINGDGKIKISDATVLIGGITDENFEKMKIAKPVAETPTPEPTPEPTPVKKGVEPKEMKSSSMEIDGSIGHSDVINQENMKNLSINVTMQDFTTEDLNVNITLKDEDNKETSGVNTLKAGSKSITINNFEATKVSDLKDGTISVNLEMKTLDGNVVATQALNNVIKNTRVLNIATVDAWRTGVTDVDVRIKIMDFATNEVSNIADIYYMVTAKDATAPSDNEILTNGKKASLFTKTMNTYNDHATKIDTSDFKITDTSLNANNNYDLYVVAVDKTTGLKSKIISTSFTLANTTKLQTGWIDLGNFKGDFTVAKQNEVANEYAKCFLYVGNDTNFINPKVIAVENAEADKTNFWRSDMVLAYFADDIQNYKKTNPNAKYFTISVIWKDKDLGTIDSDEVTVDGYIKSE